MEPVTLDPSEVEFAPEPQEQAPAESSPEPAPEQGETQETPQPPETAKTITMAEIKELADRNDVPIDDAVKQFKDAGYTIEP